MRVQSAHGISSNLFSLGHPVDAPWQSALTEEKRYAKLSPEELGFVTFARSAHMKSPPETEPVTSCP